MAGAVDQAFQVVALAVGDQAFEIAQRLEKAKAQRSNAEPLGGLLEKYGYTHCGMIYLDGVRSPDMVRVCYEKVL